jgi:hypothetical protein
MGSVALFLTGMGVGMAVAAVLQRVAYQSSLSRCDAMRSLRDELGDGKS